MGADGTVPLKWTMPRGKLIDDDLSGSVIGAFYEVYRELGFGFLEHVHVKAMEKELGIRGHTVAREFPVTVFYKGEDICQQRLDMLVDNRLVVEVKSSLVLPPTAVRQLCNYLRATHFEVGLVLHFGAEPRFYRRVMSNSGKRRSPKNA